MTNHWKQIGNSDYYITSDRLNWIISQRKPCKKSKSYPDGHKFVHETYHPNLAFAFKRVFDEITRMAVTDTIEELLRVCEETYEMLRRALQRDFDGWKTAA